MESITGGSPVPPPGPPPGGPGTPPFAASTGPGSQTRRLAARRATQRTATAARPSVRTHGASAPVARCLFLALTSSSPSRVFRDHKSHVWLIGVSARQAGCTATTRRMPQCWHGRQPSTVQRHTRRRATGTVSTPNGIPAWVYQSKRRAGSDPRDPCQAARTTPPRGLRCDTRGPAPRQAVTGVAPGPGAWWHPGTLRAPPRRPPTSERQPSRRCAAHRGSRPPAPPPPASR